MQQNYSSISTPVTEQKQKKQSIWSKLNYDSIKKYGKWGIITHLGLSVNIFSLLYLLVSRTGHSQRLINLLKLQNRVPKNAGSFILTAVIYKAIIPLRIALTITVTPFIVNKFHIQIQKQDKKGNEETNIGVNNLQKY